MTGTLINAGAIILGALLGLIFKKAIHERVRGPVMGALGVCTFVIALCGLLGVMLKVENGTVSSHGELLLLVSLVAGCAVGELLGIEKLLQKMGAAVERRFGAQGFAAGFLSASLVFAVGAMAIMGPIQNVLYGKIDILLIKSALDFTSALVFASALGFGVVFSAVSVLAVQGLAALFANALSVVPPAALNDFFMVGYAIVLCIGINFIFPTKIKTANLLPALVVPVVYNLLAALF